MEKVWRVWNDQNETDVYKCMRTPGKEREGHIQIIILYVNLENDNFKVFSKGSQRHFNFYWVYLFVWGGARVEVRGHRTGVIFFPPTLWGLNLGRQAWQQTLLPHEPSYQPTPFSLPHAVALSLAKLRLQGSLKGSWSLRVSPWLLWPLLWFIASVLPTHCHRRPASLLPWLSLWSHIGTEVCGDVGGTETVPLHLGRSHPIWWVSLRWTSKHRDEQENPSTDPSLLSPERAWPARHSAVSKTLCVEHSQGSQSMTSRLSERLRLKK